MLHKKQKALTQTHKKASPPQRPKPHHLMKCEKGTWRSHVPFSHFGGCGGTSSPHKKKQTYRLKYVFIARAATWLPLIHHFSVLTTSALTAIRPFESSPQPINQLNVYSGRLLESVPVLPPTRTPGRHPLRPENMLRAVPSRVVFSPSLARVSADAGDIDTSHGRGFAVYTV